VICSVFGIHRSVLYNKSKLKEKDDVLLQKIKDTLKIILTTDTQEYH